jgi:hypothetical protein
MGASFLGGKQKKKIKKENEKNENEISKKMRKGENIKKYFI